MGLGKLGFGRLIDVGEAESEGGRALLEERYRALQRQIPLLYLIALGNFAGLHLATTGFISFFSPSSLLAGLVVVRLAHWLRTRGLVLPPEQIRRELQKTLFFAFAFSVAFCIWGHLLMNQGGSQQHYVILFGSLAAIGCGYGLSSFPSAARLPLLFLGFPLALRLIVSPDPGQVAVGVSLALVILIIVRLLDIQNEGFTQLVGSRSAIAAERERARQAERVAKAEKAKVKKVADTDPLTGLANRRAFLRSLARRAGQLPRTDGGFALAVVDLDGFKPINDTFGHATGDAVLREVGGRLVRVAGHTALVARTGGDEFALLLPEGKSAASARGIGKAICATLEEPFVIEGRQFRISGCCGITLLSAAQCEVTESLIRADTALYRAKQDGRGAVAVFTPQMQERNRRRVQIEKALRLSETQQDIAIVFQPIRDLATGELRAFEALARWDHDGLGTVSPSEFIPIAEQINVIKELSDILLAKAALEARGWAESVRLSFNISAVQLCTAGSSERILSILERASMHPGRLQIEVTETAMLADFTVARENLKALRSAGALIVLDDFGAGHASISYLREMQFDGIKLDGTLIASSTDSLRSRRLLKGVVDLCASLGLPCVAEHVETAEQLALLRELGCRDGQGYLLSPPLDAAAAKELAKPIVTALTKRHAA